VLASVDLH